MSDVESNNPDSGLDEAANRLAAILGSDDDNQDGDEAQHQSTEQGDEPDDAQDEASDESEQDEQDGTEETGEAEDQATDTLEEVEFDGKKAKIPQWLKPALLRQQDYTRKTQELAEQRKAVESKDAQTQQLQQQYAYSLQLVNTALQQTLPPAPPPEMWDDDPIAAMRMDRQHRSAYERLQAVQAEQQRLGQQHQQRMTAEQQQSLAQAAAKLPELIPAWKDEKKAEAERPELRKYLEGLGYSREEIASAADPRAIALTRKAWLYDQLIAKQKTAKPSVPAVLPAGPARTPQSNTGRQRDFARAKQSGRVEDAAASIVHLLD